MKDLNKIKNFITRLNEIGFAEWNDHFGNYFVQIGDGILYEYIREEKCHFLVSDFLVLQTNNSPIFSQVISIGGFQVHNQGKKEAQNLNLDLTTIPIPLSNDSFGTNRYSIIDNEQSPSIRSIYPRKTIFDLQELSKFGKFHSFNGIGEFLGLYYSVIDYTLKDDINPDEECLAYIIENIEHFLHLYNFGNERETLRCIAINLVIKCLIMRTNEDHQIGCGIDHSLARIFEREHGFSHGKAVYMGCLITCLLFPEWEKWGLSFSLLMEIGHNLGFLGKEDIHLIRQTSILNLVKEAMVIRKNRKTMLQRLSKDRISNAHQHINHYLKWDI